MRASTVFFVALSATFAAGIVPLRAEGEDAVAVQYHFAGADNLSKNTNFQVVSHVFHSPSSVHFEGLVLNRMARTFWKKLQFDPGGQPETVLSPLLDDLMYLESIASFNAGGDSFVLAARMDTKRAQAWREKLETAMDGKGGSISGFSGRQWKNGFWMIEVPGWVMVGKGDRLPGVRDEYLRQIQKSGVPGPPMQSDQWFEAYVDWPQLSTGNLPHLIPLKPARTAVSISASGGRFHVRAELTYPDAVPWTPKPWRIPKELVGEPLISFTAAQEVAPFMQLGSIFSKLPDDPFADQFYCWAERNMPFQAYMAWPVGDGTKDINKLSTKGLGVVNPFLQSWDNSRLKWSPRASEIIWNVSPLTGPFLRSVSEKEGDYLLAGLFPVEKNQPPPPPALWRQFGGRNDLVYYNWEVTGLRIHQWRLFSEIVPQMLPVSGRANPGLAIVESWLTGLEPALGNTVTEVTRNSPEKLMVTRSAPFVFTGLELVWLSHWLTGEPAGPVNMNLLPKAKITGPGIPSR